LCGLDLRSGIERLDQHIGDVVAEGGEDNSLALLDVGRTDEAPRDIDDTDGFERRCVSFKGIGAFNRSRARKQRRSARLLEGALGFAGGG
jgi:hypothetical protein